MECALCFQNILCENCLNSIIKQIDTTRMKNELDKAVHDYCTGDLVSNLEKIQDILNTTIISCKFIIEKQKKDSLSVFHGILFTLEIFDDNIIKMLKSIKEN